MNGDAIYMDNNATTKVADGHRRDDAVSGALYGNPSSMHTFGGQVGSKLGKARARVARLWGCQPEEIIFTSCGTESDNTAIRGPWRCCREADGGDNASGASCRAQYVPAVGAYGTTLSRSCGQAGSAGP